MVMTMAAMSTMGERLIDERLWQSNVIDLKQVMSLAKSVYVLLEHHNEARLRVAVEIVTCPVARKCLWWNDNWYADEAQHKYFKQIVRDKLGMVVTAVKGVFTNIPEEPSTPEGDGVDVGALRKKLEEAEAVARSAQGQQRLLEMQMREAQSQLQEATERIKALEKSLDGMREKARQLTTQAAQQQAELQSGQGEPGHVHNGKGWAGSPEGPAGGLGTSSSSAGGGQVPTSSGTSEERKRLAELERLIKLGEVERDKLQQRINELQDKLLRSELAANRAPRPKGAQQLPPEQQAAEEAAAAVQVGKAAVVAQGSDAKKIAELTALLEAERKKVQELEEQMQPVKVELGKVQEKVGFSEQRATVSERRVEILQERVKVLETELQNASKTPVPQEASKKVAVASAGTDDRDEEIAELRRKTKLVEPLQEKVSKKDEEIAALKEELAKLEDLKNRMARTLAQVREQLRKVTEIAERKGFGKIIAEIMSEAQVTETINSPEFTCFARLWEDALRRQQKARFIERRRMGVSDEEQEQASPREKHFLLKRSRQTPTAGSATHRYGAEWDDHLYGGFSQDRTGSSLSLDGTQSAKQDMHWHGTGEAYQAGYDAGYRAGWEGCSNSTRVAMGSTSEAQGTIGRQPARPNALMLSQSDAVVQDLGIGSSMRIAGLGRGPMSHSAPLLPTGATSPDHASRSFGVTTPLSPMDGQSGLRSRLGAESAFDNDHNLRSVALGTTLGQTMRTPMPLGHIMSRSAKALTRTLSEWPGAGTGGSGPSVSSHGRPKTHAGLPHSPTSMALGELPLLAVTVPAGTVEALSNHSPTPSGTLRLGAPAASAPSLPVAPGAVVAEEAASRAAVRGAVWARLPAPLGTRRSSSPALSPRTLWRSKRPVDLDVLYPNRAGDQGSLTTSPPVTGYSLTAKPTVIFAASAFQNPKGARTSSTAVIPALAEEA